MKHIKILYGVECFGGGVLKHVVDLASNLNRDVFQVHIITSSLLASQEFTKGIGILKDNGVIVQLLPIRHNISIYEDISAIYLIAKYINANKIDIVHSHSSKAGVLFRIAARINNVPCLYSPHCFYFLALKGIKRSFFLLVEKLLYKITDNVIISANELSAAKQLTNNRQDKIHIINNVINKIDYIRYSQSTIRAKLELPDSDIIIGGIGRLTEQKGWVIFIDTASELLKMRSDITFLIAGDGPDRSLLENIISKKGICDKFHLIGFAEDISVILSCLDVFVSTSRWEGLPYTYLEAENFNIPMVISHTLDIEQVLNMKNCHLFPVGDHKELLKLVNLQIATKSGPNKVPLQKNNISFDLYIDSYQTLYITMIHS